MMLHRLNLIDMSSASGLDYIREPIFETQPRERPVACFVSARGGLLIAWQVLRDCLRMRCAAADNAAGAEREE